MNLLKNEKCTMLKNKSPNKIFPYIDIQYHLPAIWGNKYRTIEMTGNKINRIIERG